MNQAAPLADGQQVVIPSREEAASGILTGAGSSISGGASGTQDGASGADGQTEALVNINLATEEELQTLPVSGKRRQRTLWHTGSLREDFPRLRIL